MLPIQTIFIFFLILGGGEESGIEAKGRTDYTHRDPGLGGGGGGYAIFSFTFQIHRLPRKTCYLHCLTMLLLPDDFLGATSSSQLNFTPHNSSTQLPTTSTAPTGTPLLSPVLSPGEERDATLSVSSDSISLPTQVEVRPEPVVTELAKKLTEASLEDVADKTQEEQRPGKGNYNLASAPGKSNLPLEAQVEAVTQPEVTVDGASARASAPTSKPEAAKEEGPQDLRVFELNSDSGKSTPSNNGKKGTMT